MKNFLRSALLICGPSAVLVLLSQQPPPPPGARAERWKKMSADAEKTGLAQPYRGVVSGGKIETGLFPLRSTGVSTAPVRQAAAAFLTALTPEQRARSTFAVDDVEWRKWMNQSFYVRQGVSFAEMSEAQRGQAFNLLRASLSAKGVKLSRDIMRLNRTLGELNSNDFEAYDEWLYHITVMGEPSAGEPWGWQLDGHHLIVNYFVLGDQVVMSPAFWGSEPVIARAGKYQRTAILQEEQAAGLALLRSLDPAQRQKAVLSSAKTKNNNLGEAFQDNVDLDYAGLAAQDMTPAQRDRLLALMNLWVSNLRDPHAKVQLEDVKKHLDRTHFAWIGGDSGDAVFYFRIHSPVILIEFDHQLPANTRHLQKDPRAPMRDHIHTVVRTPNGNDYGKDLLRQHHEKHPHPHGH